MRFQAFLIALVVTFCSSASAQTVINGDFELAATGWTATNVDGSGGHRTTGGNPNGFFILNSSGSPSTNPTLTQPIVGLIPGQSYQITGDYIRVHSGGVVIDEFGVEIDGNLWEFDLSSNVAWSSFDQTFTYTGGSNLLTLTGERHADNSAGVDNIAIALVIPEPGALSLLALCAPLALRRR